MTYAIGCRESASHRHWVYYVILRVGSTVYKGETDYTTHRAAVRAAKRAGAIEA